MNNIDFILVIIILYCIYLIYNLFKSNKIKSEDITESKIEHYENTYDQDTNLDALIKHMNNIKQDKEKIEVPVLNPFFQEKQFHNDYRDLITALSNLVPSNKQLFNIANQPIKYSVIENSNKNVSLIVQDVVDNINTNIKNEVTDVRTSNTGWDEAVPDPQMESGWEKFMKNLGLSPSIHKPISVRKSNVKLISIDKIQKYETEDEIRYIITLILQKENIKDQIILKISLTQDKSMVNDENNFFKSHTIVMKTMIERIDIVGYLSNEGIDDKQNYLLTKDNYFGVDNLEHNNMTDPQYILDQLSKKHLKTQKEMEFRNSLLDEEGQAQHNLPYVANSDSYKMTQTIYDDYNSPREFN